jgi:transcriptional regulator with XRE-family HTH domain
VAYLRMVMDHAPHEAVANRSGVNQTTVTRWLNGSRPRDPAKVAAFARAYPGHTTVLEAFVAAGFLTEKEAQQGLPNR